MWINIDGEEFNFSLVLRYKREGKNLYITDISNTTRMIYYKSEHKAKQVESYLKRTLNSNLVINSGINEPNNLY